MVQMQQQLKLSTRDTVINPSFRADCIIVRGFYSTIYKFYQIRNLIFTTQGLPIRDEFLNSSFDFISSTTFTSEKILNSHWKEQMH